MRLPLVDRYVLRQISAPLLTAIAIGLMVLLAERLVRLLDITLGKKNSFAVVFELLAYLVPHYLGLALPAAMFLGLLFGFNKMSKDSEIDAFLAAGIGLHRLIRPAAILAIILAVASLGIFGWLQPHTRYAYRSVLFNVTNVEVFYLAEEGVFMQSGSRTFILDELERSKNKFHKIFLFDFRGAKGAQTITAKNGSLISLPHETRPVLRLQDGVRLKLDKWPDKNARNPKKPSQTSNTFDMVDTPLGRTSVKQFRPRGIDQREMTLPEIIRAIDHPPTGISSYEIRSELHKRLVSIATILILPFLALPFAMGRRRGQRAYRFAIALVILIAFHEIIQQGALMTKINGTSPYLTMWLPLALLSLFSIWQFWQVAFRNTSDRVEMIADRLADLVNGLKRRILPQREEGI